MKDMSSDISRREFLEGAVALSVAMHGLGGVGCTGGGARSTASAAYPSVPENAVSLPKNGKKVLIIGAGLSGLMSACELLDRGFDVTIIEKNLRPGGKLISWRDKKFGVPRGDADWPGYPLEHGTHVVGGFYKNFREFISRHGLRLRDKISNAPYSPLSFVYPDGLIDDRDLSIWPAPWHASSVLEGLKRNNLGSVNSIRFYQHLALMAFKAGDSSDVDYLDSISMRDWMEKQGFSKEILGAAIDPILRMSNFKNSDESSALAWHRFVGSVFGARGDFAGFQFFQDSTDESIIQPLLRYVLEKGGRVHFTTEAEGFVEASGRLAAVRTRAISEKMYICPICGELHPSRPSRCSRCGYVGDEFGQADGESARPRRFEADYFLLAVDPLGAKKILSDQMFGRSSEFSRLGELACGSVGIVYLWYSRGYSKSSWAERFAGREVFFGGEFPYLETTMNLSVLKEKSFSDVNADIIENQISSAERIAHLGDKEVAGLVDHDLRRIMPGLSKPTDYRVLRWNNFSNMVVGSESARPAVETSIDNLFILGDYVRLKHNAIFMEKVTVAVRSAVNKILEKENLSAHAIRVLESGTPNLMLHAVKKLVSVRAR